MLSVQVSAFADRYATVLPPADFAELVTGETVRLYGQLAATGDVLTITGTPTFQLFSAESSLPVSGFTAPVSATAHDSGAAATVTAEYLLDSTGLEVGDYVGKFSIAALASDGQTALYEPLLRLRIAPVE